MGSKRGVVVVFKFTYNLTKLKNPYKIKDLLTKSFKKISEKST